jgi:hypothetical protein
MDNTHRLDSPQGFDDGNRDRRAEKLLNQSGDTQRNKANRKDPVLKPVQNWKT